MPCSQCCMRPPHYCLTCQASSMPPAITPKIVVRLQWLKGLVPPPPHTPGLARLHRLHSWCCNPYQTASSLLQHNSGKQGLLLQSFVQLIHLCCPEWLQAEGYSLEGTPHYPWEEVETPAPETAALGSGAGPQATESGCKSATIVDVSQHSAR